MKRTSVMLRDDQLEALRVLKLKSGVPSGEFIRRAVDEKLKRDSKGIERAK